MYSGFRLRRISARRSNTWLWQCQVMVCVPKVCTYPALNCCCTLMLWANLSPPFHEVGVEKKSLWRPTHFGSRDSNCFLLPFFAAKNEPFPVQRTFLFLPPLLQPKEGPLEYVCNMNVCRRSVIHGEKKWKCQKSDWRVQFCVRPFFVDDDKQQEGKKLLKSTQIFRLFFLGEKKYILDENVSICFWHRFP